jgi:tRNA (cytidine/uridine-2'-O-)-methyltransferase
VKVFSVVLVHPEIPPNTGNVIRLCANTGAALHLVEPLGFPLDDAKMRRAGLDYHEFAALSVHRDWAACRAALAATAPERWFAATTSASQFASGLAYRPGDLRVRARNRWACRPAYYRIPRATYASPCWPLRAA